LNLSITPAYEYWYCGVLADVSLSPSLGRELKVIWYVVGQACQES
jgi:hypothetical protein